MTTVIPCLEVSLLLIFVSCNVIKIVLLGSLQTPLSSHTSLLLERFSIGCLLNTVLYSRLPYWCPSFVFYLFIIFLISAFYIFEDHLAARLFLLHYEDKYTMHYTLYKNTKHIHLFSMSQLY